MTNIELRDLLSKFPDDMEVLIDRNGSIHTECGKPIKRFMGTSQKDYIVLSSPINIK